MTQTIDAIFENGTFRPLNPDQVAIAEGERVRISVSAPADPPALESALSVYDGLTEDEIAEVERVALDRSRFFDAKGGQ